MPSRPQRRIHGCMYDPKVACDRNIEVVLKTRSRSFSPASQHKERINQVLDLLYTRYEENKHKLKSQRGRTTSRSQPVRKKSNPSGRAFSVEQKREKMVQDGFSKPRRSRPRSRKNNRGLNLKIIEPLTDKYAVPNHQPYCSCRHEEDDEMTHSSGKTMVRCNREICSAHKVLYTSHESIFPNIE